MNDCAEYYEFIEAHAEERVEELALRLNAFSPEARTFILRQIEGRQRLRAKVLRGAPYRDCIFRRVSPSSNAAAKSQHATKPLWYKVGPKSSTTPFWSISPAEWA